MTQEQDYGAYYLLEPPPPGSPKITAEQAIDLGMRMSVGGDPTDIQPVYAILRSKDHPKAEDLLVWLLEFQGGCIQPPQYTTCFKATWNVLVDANTGELLGSFNSPP